jgi:hypothetical protein
VDRVNFDFLTNPFRVGAGLSGRIGGFSPRWQLGLTRRPSIHDWLGDNLEAASPANIRVGLVQITRSANRVLHVSVTHRLLRMDTIKKLVKGFFGSRTALSGLVRRSAIRRTRPRDLFWPSSPCI